MTPDHDTSRDAPRVYVTGGCEGLGKLVEALRNHEEVAFVGASAEVREAGERPRSR